MKSKQPVGALVQQLRERAGLSISRLAELSGVNKANIARLESGEASQPRPDTLTRLAEVLGANPADLMAAAGYTTKTALPSFRPYLRTKYGHLPPEKLDELNKFLEQIEDEYGPKSE